MKCSVLLVAFFFFAFVYQATTSPYARHSPGRRYTLHVSRQAVHQFGDDYWDDETSDSREVPQESEESLGRNLMDCLICTLITIIRTIFGYFPTPL